MAPLERKAKITHLPSTPEPLFLVVEDSKAKPYWTVRIRDAIWGDEPVFRVEDRIRGHGPATLYDVAVAGQGEANEGRGRLTVTRWERGLPELVAVVDADHLFGVRYLGLRWSTDPERAERELRDTRGVA